MSPHRRTGVCWDEGEGVRLLVSSRTPASLPRSWGARCVPAPSSTRGSTCKTFFAPFLTSQSENPASGLGGCARTKCQLEINIAKLYRNGTTKMLPQMQPCSLVCSGLLWAHHQDTSTTPKRACLTVSLQSRKRQETCQNNLILFPFLVPSSMIGLADRLSPRPALWKDLDVPGRAPAQMN